LYLLWLQAEKNQCELQGVKPILLKGFDQRPGKWLRERQRPALSKLTVILTLEMCAEKPIYSEKIKKRSLTAKGWRKVRRAE
jgi:hypothetical protein